MKYANLVLIFLTVNITVCAQSQEVDPDREVIIIEKTLDQDGKVILKHTKRLNGQYSEQDIQEMIDDDESSSMGRIDVEGLGFGENMVDLFNYGSDRPTIGVSLSFDKGEAEVVRVHRGSGAEEADIREGDQILSVDHMAVSSIDDIHNILESKSDSDKLNIVIFRDGEEIDKNVTLRSRTSDRFFFDLPLDGSMQFFGDGSDDFTWQLDSLFDMFDFGELEQQFDSFRNLDSRTWSKTPKDKASLGVFIDDIGAGVLVSEVISDSPAETAGIRKGDVIIGMDDIDITEYDDVIEFMTHKQEGDMIEVVVERDGSQKSISVTLD